MLEKAYEAAARALRRGADHDGSDLDLAVDEDAKAIVDAALAELAANPPDEMVEALKVAADWQAADWPDMLSAALRAPLEADG